jgi:hypothetical protein
LPTRLVRRFRPGQRVEGLAGDGAGGFVYVAERLPEVDRPAKGRVAALSLGSGRATATKAGARGASSPAQRRRPAR